MSPESIRRPGSSQQAWLEAHVQEQSAWLESRQEALDWHVEKRAEAARTIRRSTPRSSPAPRASSATAG
jgi:hypothetical protein